MLNKSNNIRMLVSTDLIKGEWNNRKLKPGIYTQIEKEEKRYFSQREHQGKYAI